MWRKKIDTSGASAAVDPVSRAVEALRHGEVIVFPSETFYGLGADALNAAAVERVGSLKGRQADSPIAVIVADREMLERVVAEIPPAAEQLIGRFWPGPLTLVLPARSHLPSPLLNRAGGIGVRMSSHPLAMRLVREFGHPVTATSANPSGQEPSRTVAEARSYFTGKVSVYVDGGRLTAAKGSTVLEIVSGDLRMIREGEVSLAEIRKALRSSP
ncbi:MAG: threonylcarbamoyl-AMP synthase [Deltaproteobacteria bacterium]|nr:threonylcarbamoyl-AMP synthase [Deltaproteobacteria bacterium]